jgi:hypothetical protein
LVAIINTILNFGEESMKLRWAIVLFSLLSLGMPALAQNFGTLLGTLNDNENSRPVAEATVHIRGRQLSQDLSTKTDQQGRFAYTGLEPGLYLVMITKEGYAPLDVFDVVIDRSERTRLTLEMTLADRAPFKRKLIRYRHPLINTEDATIKSVYRTRGN